jgi:hypothetical protein
MRRTPNANIRAERPVDLGLRDLFLPVMGDIDQFRTPKLRKTRLTASRTKRPSLAGTMKGNRTKQQHHPLRTHYVQARFRMLGAADRPPQPSATPNARL